MSFDPFDNKEKSSELEEGEVAYFSDLEAETEKPKVCKY